MNLETLTHTACLMECSAPKPGNVTPQHSFEDLTHADFVRSSSITAKWISRVAAVGVGAVIEQAADEIMDTVAQNTQLGILLLLAPLAAAHDRHDIERVLSSLTIHDAKCVYRAISRMEPGGLGEANEQDVGNVPTATLLECMRLAADRDTIAAQYANGFADVLRFADKLNRSTFDSDWRNAVVQLQIDILSEIPDTLIARKCGVKTANEATSRACVVRDSDYKPRSLDDLDEWLRADGHRRNPGTTADLVAAILFVGLRDGRIVTPARVVEPAVKPGDPGR